MTTARIVLIDRALRRIGEDPLGSEDDPRAQVYIDVYDGVIERVGAAPYDFMRRTVRLVRLAEKPVHGWTYAYQLPADRIGAPRAVYANGLTREPTTLFDLQGDRLLSEHEEIWATILSLGNPATWPGDVRELVTVAMMAEFALSIREDRTLHDRLYAKAWGTPEEAGMGGLFRSTQETQSQGTPSTQVGGAVNPLIDVRW